MVRSFCISERSTKEQKLVPQFVAVGARIESETSIRRLSLRPQAAFESARYRNTKRYCFVKDVILVHPFVHFRIIFVNRKIREFALKNKGNVNKNGVLTNFLDIFLLIDSIN